MQNFKNILMKFCGSNSLTVFKIPSLNQGTFQALQHLHLTLSAV